MDSTEKKVICHDIKGKEYEVLITELQFRPSVYGAIIKDGKILLSKQWDGYDFPGGGMKLGETTTQALVREVKEETGFDVQVGKLITVFDSFFKMPVTGENMQCILLYYVCEVVGGEASIAFLDENEKQYADMPEWVDLGKARHVKFYNSADSVKIIRDAEAIIK